MKKILMFLLIFNLQFSIFNTMAKSPQAISYQAVARDNANNPIANQIISLRLTVHDGSAGGTIVYQETHSPMTNPLGLFTVNLGEGAFPTGIFSNINWSGSKYLQIELDPMGGNTFIDMGTQQMLSVPFALYADNASSDNFVDLTTNQTAAGNKTWSGLATFNGGAVFSTDINVHSLSIGVGPGGYGLGNTILGEGALQTLPAGSSNTAVGAGSLSFNKGNENTATGVFSLYNNTFGNANSAYGLNTLMKNTTGNQNTGIGNISLLQNIAGVGNSALGFGSLLNNTNGNNNSAFGWQSLSQNITGSENTALGYGADVASDGLTNATALGANAIVGASNSLVLGNNVNVGIGTNAPKQRLQVNGNITLSQRGQKIIFGANPGDPLDESICYITRRVGTDELYSEAADIFIRSITTPLNLEASTSVNIRDLVGNTKMIFNTQTGNAGINISSPSQRLQVNGNISFTTTGQKLFFPSNPLSDTNSCYITRPVGTDGLQLYANDIYIRSIVTPIQLQTVSTINMTDLLGNTKMIFNTQTGKVGIGTTAPAEELEVVGNGLFSGNVTASCGVLICSDIRYKKTITPLKGALEKVSLLNGVNYYFKKEEFPKLNFTDDKQIGLIAQDVEKIYPELVKTDDNGFKSIDYAKLTPILVEAIKELKAENSSLKSSLDNLQTQTTEKLNSLEAKINLLMNIAGEATNK